MKTFMFVFAVVLAIGLCNVASAQENHSADISLTVTVGTTPLDIAGVDDLTLDDGGVGALPPGIPVAAVPDGADAWLLNGLGGIGSNSTPALGGQPGSFDVLGQAGASVIVSFALPYVLYPSANGNGVVHVDYNGTSACWADANGTAFYFNPKNGTTVTMNADGATATHFNLGGVFTVDPGAAADDYIGVAIVTVAYAAN